jgi:hypothetical protein
MNSMCRIYTEDTISGQVNAFASLTKSQNAGHSLQLHLILQNSISEQRMVVKWALWQNCTVFTSRYVDRYLHVVSIVVGTWITG